MRLGFHAVGLLGLSALVVSMSLGLGFILKMRFRSSSTSQARATWASAAGVQSLPFACFTRSLWSATAVRYGSEAYTGIFYRDRAGVASQGQASLGPRVSGAMVWRRAGLSPNEVVMSRKSKKFVAVQFELPVTYDRSVTSAKGTMELFLKAYEGMAVALRRECAAMALWSRIREEQRDPDNAPLV